MLERKLMGRKMESSENVPETLGRSTSGFDLV
jgi:hypothetical protein